MKLEFNIPFPARLGTLCPKVAVMVLRTQEAVKQSELGDGFSKVLLLLGHGGRSSAMLVRGNLQNQPASENWAPA